MDLRPGSRWKSAVCDAQLVVVRPPSSAGELQCGGVAVVPIDDTKAPTGAIDPAFADGVVIGKRYVDEASGLEVLGAKAGAAGDAAILELAGQRLAFTSDTFVVRPWRFPGGDIGKLAACGTINDLPMVGARPLWLPTPTARPGRFLALSPTLPACSTCRCWKTSDRTQ